MDDFTVLPEVITYPSISIEARGEHDSSREIKTEGYSVGASLHWDPEDNTLNLTVAFKNADDEDPDEYNRKYNFEIHVYAVFNMSTNYLDISEKTALGMLNDVAACIFGSIREMLILLTSRSPWGPYILPMLDAEDLAAKLYESGLKKPVKSRSRKSKVVQPND